MVRDFMGLSEARPARRAHQLQLKSNDDGINSSQQTLTMSTFAALGWITSSIADHEVPHVFEESQKDRKLESLVGCRAGILSAVFPLSQVLTAMYLNSLANKGDTKPLIQVSQFSAVATNLVLGFAPTYSFAVVARFLSGLLNSTSGAIKTNAARAYDMKQQPTVLGYMMSCYPLGIIISPGLGDLVAKPCTTWSFMKDNPICDGSSGLLMKFPFLIPFGLCSLMSAVSYVVTMVLLQPEEVMLASWPSQDDQQGNSPSDQVYEHEAAREQQDNAKVTTALLKDHAAEGSVGEHGPSLDDALRNI